MSSKYYKYCIVPQCGSTTVKTPNKLFIHVPKKAHIRKQWLQLARREPNMSTDSRLYFCEDHFDLPNDMENYTQYRIMGSVSQIRMKPGCVPKKFYCQPDRKQACTCSKQPYKKQKKMVSEESLNKSVKSSSSIASEDTSGTSSVLHMDQEQEAYKTANTVQLQNDMTNYTRYRVMGSVKKIMMKPGCMPTKFDCQKSRPDIVSTTSDLNESQTSTAIEESLGGTELTAVKSENNEIMFTNSEGRCPMIEIPLSTKQFALQAGFEAVGLSVSSDEDPDNTSLYCEDDSASEQNTQPQGENSMFKGFQCSVCDSEIIGFRYTCVQCSDLDLCGACEAARAHHHHYVLRVPADRHAEETEAVLATIRLHLMKDLDPIAELEPDPGKSVKLEIKAESEEEVNITLEQEFNVATPDLIVPDTKFIDESMVLPIEINEIEDPQVPLNVSTMESEMTSEIELTEKATGTKRKICATNMQQNTKKEYLKPRIYKRKTLRTLITEEQISKAKTLIQEGNSKRRAAELVGISEGALRKRLKSEHVPTSLGRFKPTFTEEQEEEFATQCQKMNEMFHGISNNDLRRLAYEFASTNNIENRFDDSLKMAGRDWVAGFIQRNPHLGARQSESLNVSRATDFNKAQVDLFYKNLKQVVEEYNFQPNKIYTMDETEISSDPKRMSKAVSVKGKVSRTVSAEGDVTVTAILCMNVTGHFIPPAFIYPHKISLSELLDGGPTQSICMVSENGYFNSKLFIEWLQHFKDFTRPSDHNPVLLILDNHSSHISIEGVKYAREHHIVLLVLPPNGSQKLQPLNVAIHAQIKAKYMLDCQQWMSQHPGRELTQCQMACLFNAVYKDIATLSNAESGFKATGIFPFADNLFDETDFEPSSDKSMDIYFG